MCPISTRRCPGRRAAPEPATGQWKSARSGRCSPMKREGEEAPRAAAEAVARRSYGKLVAFLAARTGDVAGAEDALADAFAAALSDWDRSGIPDNPEGWLLTVARRRAVDAVRRRHTGEV